MGFTGSLSGRGWASVRSVVERAFVEFIDVYGILRA
jgi:hypothetical protein